MGPAVLLAAAGATLAWVGIVQLLHKRRVKFLSSLSSLQEVARRLSTEDFPFLWRKSLEFALYRTYAIPSISKLLQATGQFQACCGKRYDDTDLLISEVVTNPFGSERSNTALARMNQIHGQYAISNADFLYVLCTFVVQPVRWVDAHGFRRLTPRERDANAHVYRAMGEGMGLRDLPQTYDEFEAYHDDYERKHMRHAPSNEIIGEATTRLFLVPHPRWSHPVARQAMAALMDDRLRQAMGLAKPPALLVLLVQAALAARKVLQRLLLPSNTRYKGRVPLAAPQGAGGLLKYCYAVYEDTYPCGYAIRQLGPTQCPALKESAVEQVAAVMAAHADSNGQQQQQQQLQQRAEAAAASASTTEGRCKAD